MAYGLEKYTCLTAIEPLIYMWLSAFVPLYVVGFGNLTVQGRCYQNFKWTLISLVFMQQRDLSEPR
jgi:hypothetical protein